MTITNLCYCILSRVYPKQSLRAIVLLLTLTTTSCLIPNVDAQTPSGNAKIIGPDTTFVGQEIEISIELINPNQVNNYNFSHDGRV